MPTLDRVLPGECGVVVSVAGERAFRRRIMELGLLCGNQVQVVRVAPLGDPIELRVRGCCLSIRARDARGITVSDPRGDL